MNRVCVPGLLALLIAVGCRDRPNPVTDRDQSNPGTARDRAISDTAVVAADVVVRLTTEGILPDTLRFIVGDTVRLMVRNEANQALEFLIGREATPYTFKQPFFADVRILHMEGPIVAAEIATGEGAPARPGGAMRHAQLYFYLKPGEVGTLTFVVPTRRQGVWEMACFLGAHGDAGLRGVVVVLPQPAR